MLARALALCCPVVVTAASFHIETDNVPAVPVARRRDPTVERWGLYELALSGPAAAPTPRAVAASACPPCPPRLLPP
eukprot:COSAG06_NODE_20256_length_802_cov_1.570413_1_plen_76_part_10